MSVIYYKTVQHSLVFETFSEVIRKYLSSIPLCTTFWWHCLPVLEFFMNTTVSAHSWFQPSWPFSCQSQGLDLLFSHWYNISKASLLSPSSLCSDAILSEPYLPLYLGQKGLPFAWWHQTTDLCYLWFCICKLIYFLKLICNSKMNTCESFAVMCGHTQRAKCTYVPSWERIRCLSAFLSLLSYINKWAFCSVFNSCVLHVCAFCW